MFTHFYYFLEKNLIQKYVGVGFFKDAAKSHLHTQFGGQITDADIIATLRASKLSGDEKVRQYEQFRVDMSKYWDGAKYTGISLVSK